MEKYFFLWSMVSDFDHMTSMWVVVSMITRPTSIAPAMVYDTGKRSE